jgi:hypothetical protein
MDGGSARRKTATYAQNNTNTDNHALSGIRTHDLSVRAGEDGSCLRPRRHCDRLTTPTTNNNDNNTKLIFLCLIRFL